MGVVELSQMPARANSNSASMTWRARVAAVTVVVALVTAGAGCAASPSNPATSEAPGAASTAPRTVTTTAPAGRGGAVGTAAPARTAPAGRAGAVGRTSAAARTGAAALGGATLSIEARPVARFSDNFNPFDKTSPLNQDGALWYTYEPLLQYNPLQVDQYYPWLASSWSFSSSGLSITFDLRPKVKWDDGAAFSASDVAYTFNLLKDYPAINPGLPIISAVAANATTFVLTLSQPGYAYLYDIARVPIVRAGYSPGANPGNYVDRQPDGTGPYSLARPSDLNTRRLVLTARPGYWQGAPPFEHLVFPALADDAAVLGALRSGALDWAGTRLPDASAEYVATDKSDNHFWAPSVDCVALELNLERPSLDKLAVRQAISDALNRADISQQVDGVVAVPAKTLSGLILPRDNMFLASHAGPTLAAHGDPAAVASLMKKSGYAIGPHGYWSAPRTGILKLDIEDPPGSGFAAAAATIAQELDAAGFDASSSEPPTPTWHRDVVDGDFDATVTSSASGPSPFYMYKQWLDPALLVDGKATSGDYERLGSAGLPAVAALARAALSRFTNSLSDSPGAIGAVKALAAIVAGQLPVTPLLYGAAWGEFSTRRAIGWPGPANPYEPATPRENFAEYTLLQLSPAPAT